MPWLEDEHLVTQLIALMRLVVEHAVGHCAISGDAAVRVSVDGYDRGDGWYKYPSGLMHKRHHGFPEPRTRDPVLKPPLALHTINAGACFRSTRELLVSCHMILMDLFRPLVWLRSSRSTRTAHFAAATSALGRTMSS
jgi:hypothetical protein